MSSLLASVDQRTQLVGENRLELLIFKLNTRHLFAINVFKVREVLSLPKLNKLPGSHYTVCGVATVRGTPIPVIDLRAAIGMRPLEQDENANIIITEYNRTVQAFLVGQVMNIVNTSWQEIQPPPTTAGKHNYLTAITQLKQKDASDIVEIIDVEKVLAEIVHYDVNVSAEIIDTQIIDKAVGQRILIVDDSVTARNQIKDTLEPFGIHIIEAANGLQALNLLKHWLDKGKDIHDEILMMFTDAEMPEMDGYKLTHEVRSDPRMKDLFITLNTSLSGNFNEAMIEKVGCNRLISKFQPDLLLDVVQERLRQTLV